MVSPGDRSIVNLDRTHAIPTIPVNCAANFIPEGAVIMTRPPLEQHDQRPDRLVSISGLGRHLAKVGKP